MQEPRTCGCCLFRKRATPQVTAGRFRRAGRDESNGAPRIRADSQVSAAIPASGRAARAAGRPLFLPGFSRLPARRKAAIPRPQDSWPGLRGIGRTSDPCARMHLPENDPGRFVRWLARRVSISRNPSCGNFLLLPVNSSRSPITPKRVSPQRGRETITRILRANKYRGHDCRENKPEFRYNSPGVFAVPSRRGKRVQQDDEAGRSYCFGRDGLRRA